MQTHKLGSTHPHIHTPCYIQFLQTNQCKCHIGAISEQCSAKNIFSHLQVESLFPTLHSLPCLSPRFHPLFAAFDSLSVHPPPWDHHQFSISPRTSVLWLPKASTPNSSGPSRTRRGKDLRDFRAWNSNHLHPQERVVSCSHSIDVSYYS